VPNGNAYFQFKPKVTLKANLDLIYYSILGFTLLSTKCILNIKTIELKLLFLWITI